MRLIIDISHILKERMFAAQNTDSVTFVEFEGEEVKIPDPYEAYEIFLTSLDNTLKDLRLTPCNIVLVKDGYNCKAMRREFLEGYCVRPKRAPEWGVSFNKCLDMVEDTLLKYGAISVTKDGFEADDIIAALASKTDSIIWSGDGDLQAAGDVYYKGVINEPKYFGIAKDVIVVYKSLVGDNSDKIPGSKGYGDKTFLKMIEQFGEDCLYEIKEMLENEDLTELEEFVGDFKPFQKIIDCSDVVYASYKCAKFYHPGYKLDWKQLYPSGNKDLTQWEPTQELITKDKLTLEFFAELKQYIIAADFVSLDIETHTTEDGDAWMEANKNAQGKKPLDVLGSKLDGFSITAGENCHKTWYFSVNHLETNNISLDDAEQILNMLPTNKPVVCHNTSFELAVLRQHFTLKYDRGYLPQSLYDTKILAGYVDEYDLANLKHLSKRWMDHDQETYEEVTTIDGVRYKMNELTGEHVLSYGASDTICTSQLFSFFELFTRYEESWNCYCECDITAQFMYSEKFLNGIRFDLDKLEELTVENAESYTKVYKKLQEYLANLTWTETVIEEKPKQRITLADLKRMQAEGTIGKEEEAKVEEIAHTWPGCEFIPAPELTPAEIKRLHLVYTGEVLKCGVRKLDKIAAVIENEDFSKLVLDEDLDGLNSLVSGSFTPTPDINVKSNTQMTKLFYKFLDLPVRVRGKVSDVMRSKGQRQGNSSANKSAMEHAIVYDLQDDPERMEFMKDLMLAVKLRTEDGLFLRPYKNMPHYLDGMVHPQFAVSAQKSGRGTASGPNDAQIAKDGELRQVYSPYSDAYVFISMDFSSQELAHTAGHCKDTNMLACFNGDRLDIHGLMGCEIVARGVGRPADPSMTYEKFNLERKTNKDLNDVRNKQAKPTNFGKVYGQTPPALAIKLLCPLAEAESLQGIYDEKFPGVGVWQEKVVAEAKDLGYAVTPMGRRRHIANVLDGSWKDNHEFNAVTNHPIQGGSAEQVKLVIKALWEARVFERFDAFWVGTVHDELNSIVRKDQVLDFIREVHPLMTLPFAGLPVEFKSSIEVGRNFGTLVEIGEEFDEEAIQKVLNEI